MIHCLRLSTSNAGDSGSIPVQGNNFLHSVQKKKKKKQDHTGFLDGDRHLLGGRGEPLESLGAPQLSSMAISGAEAPFPFGTEVTPFSRAWFLCRLSMAQGLLASTGLVVS